jgi:hypothetical protein
MIFNNNAPVIFIQIKNKEAPAVVPCGETLGNLTGQPQGVWPLYGGDNFFK